MIDVSAVRAFCESREVDLVLAPPPAPYALAPYALCLHGEFDGYGDFFSLVFRDVEYLELPGGLTVGDLVRVDEVAALAELAPKWARLRGVYSGPAVAFRTADSEAWGADEHAFVVVANHIECLEGRDWHSPPGAVIT